MNKQILQFLEEGELCGEDPNHSGLKLSGSL